MNPSDARERRAFGLWSSPLSAQMLGQSRRLDEVQWSQDGRSLLWLEGRSGRGVLVCQAEGEASRELTDELNVRGPVGYGGGEFTSGVDAIIFAERGGRLYRRPLGAGQARPITPPFGMCASPVLSPDGRWVLYVFSDGQNDRLGLVDAEGRDWPVQFARGADFYMNPVWHPGGEWVAWVEWDHPNMPWDGTRLKLGRAAGSPPRLTDEQVVAGGADTPVAQPLFSPDGRWLSYIVTGDEWDRLEVLDLQTMEKKVLVEGDFHLSDLAWVQGIHSYGWSRTSQRLSYTRVLAGAFGLWSVDLAGKSQPIECAPYTRIRQLSVSPADDSLAFIASAPSIPDRIVRMDKHGMRVVMRSQGEDIPADYFGVPQAVTWAAKDGTPVHGLYTPPTNPRFSGRGLPPVILHIHGGPSSVAPVGYSSDVLFFTTRGFGYMEVNYRGSSTYGRRYLNALRGNWGVTDTEDAAGAARALITQGLADPKRLVISGGSAGGYTVLNALAHHPGLFRAGICCFGVTDLFALARDTHKFELHYTDSLVGSLPEAGALYRERSPLTHCAKIRDALAFFQGAEDVVVPPAQTESMVQALQRAGVTSLYRLYPGEGHGFRRSETIIDYYNSALRFLEENVVYGVD